MGLACLEESCISDSGTIGVHQSVYISDTLV